LGAGLKVSKVALITGAGRGIGAGIARELASMGFNVAINYHTSQKLAEALCEELVKQWNIKVIQVKADVADPSQVENMIATVKRDLGPISVLVCNAGIVKDTLLARMSIEDWHRVIDVNLSSAFYATKAVYLDMAKQRWGRLIYISSVVGLLGNAGQANYAAAKSGLIGFCKSVARELGPRNITANVVAPGYIETDITSTLKEEWKQEILKRITLGRFGKVEDVAGLVGFLCSDKGSYITGQVISVDGGLFL